MVLPRLALGVALAVQAARAAPKPQTVTLTPTMIPDPDYTGTNPPPYTQPERTWLPSELSSLIPTPGGGGGGGGGERSDPPPTPTPQPDPENGAGETPEEGIVENEPQVPEEPEEELGCRSTGIDYVNGGTYNIDVTSDEFFFFTSAFKGMSVLRRLGAEGSLRFRLRECHHLPVHGRPRGLRISMLVDLYPTGRHRAVF